MSPISASAFGGEEADAATDEAPKKKRRTKAELTADAVIPGNDDMIALKDLATGAKYERSWVVAVEMVREGKAEFVDKTLKYAVLKMEQGGEQQAPTPARTGLPSDGPDPDMTQDEADGLEGRWVALQEEIDETKASDTEKLSALAEESNLVRQQLIDAGYEDVESDDAYNRRMFMVGSDDRKIPLIGEPIFKDKIPTTSIPPEAELGDEVRIGAETYSVGHGGVLTSSVVADENNNTIKPKNRWQRELGSGVNGPWEKTIINSEGGADNVIATPKPSAFEKSVEVAKTETPIPNFEPVGADVQQLSNGGWRVTAGYLEKIGLPEYSSIQIGPVIASRDVMVVDESDRISVTREDGSVISAPRAVVEAQRGCFHAAEISMRYERGAFLAFLEAARPGSTKSS